MVWSAALGVPRACKRAVASTHVCILATRCPPSTYPAPAPPRTRAVAQQVAARLWQDVLAVEGAAHSCQLLRVAPQQVAYPHRLRQLVAVYLCVEGCRAARAGRRWAGWGGAGQSKVTWRGAAAHPARRSAGRPPPRHARCAAAAAGGGGWLAVDAVQAGAQLLHTLSGRRRRHHLHRLSRQVVTKVGCRGRVGGGEGQAEMSRAVATCMRGSGQAEGGTQAPQRHHSLRPHPQGTALPALGAAAGPARAAPLRRCGSPPPAQHRVIGGRMRGLWWA